MKIAVIFGGSSREKEVSLKSAKSIIDSLNDSYDIYPFEIKNNYRELVLKLKELKIDLVINALHGGEGENGVIQSIFDKHNVKYTGSGPTASKIAMDKNETKTICINNNIPTPDWIYLDLKSLKIDEIDLDLIIDKFNGSYVVKPSDEGSSLGLKIVKDNLSKDELRKAIEKVSLLSKEIIVEQYIDGRELTVSLLGGKALPIIEIIPKGFYYDFSSKYKKGQSEYIVPAILSKNIDTMIREYALKLYEKIGCRTYSRVDIILGKNNIYILEINTLPGFTNTSLLPMAANQAGMSYQKLLDKIIHLSLF